MTEDKMVGWYYQLNGQDFEQALRDSEGQRSLAWSRRVGHNQVTEPQQNNKEADTSVALGF